MLCRDVSLRHCALDPINVSLTLTHTQGVSRALWSHGKVGEGSGVSQDWCAAVGAPGRRERVEWQRAASAGQTGAVHGGVPTKSTRHVLAYFTRRRFEKQNQTKSKTNKQNGLPSTIKICPFTQIGQAAKEEARFLTVTCCCSCCGQSELDEGPLPDTAVWEQRADSKKKDR